jgi:hypothetical protein
MTFSNLALMLCTIRQARTSDAVATCLEQVQSVMVAAKSSIPALAVNVTQQRAWSLGQHLLDANALRRDAGSDTV